MGDAADCGGPARRLERAEARKTANRARQTTRGPATAGCGSPAQSSRAAFAHAGRLMLQINY